MIAARVVRYTILAFAVALSASCAQRPPADLAAILARKNMVASDSILRETADWTSREVAYPQGGTPVVTNGYLVKPGPDGSSQTWLNVSLPDGTAGWIVGSALAIEDPSARQLNGNGTGTRIQSATPSRSEPAGGDVANTGYDSFADRVKAFVQNMSGSYERPGYDSVVAAFGEPSHVSKEEVPNAYSAQDDFLYTLTYPDKELTFLQVTNLGKTLWAVVKLRAPIGALVWGIGIGTDSTYVKEVFGDPIVETPESLQYTGELLTLTFRQTGGKVSGIELVHELP
jgi:hypothetical protein